MIEDFQDYQDGAQINTDICIIGAGATGIAMAREFLGSNVEVLVLESGGLNLEPAIEALNQGESIGLPSYKNALVDGRNRVLGGTTRTWSGQCVPMDDIDFAPRAWVPHSGWSITKADLESYYHRAEAYFKVEGEVYDERIWQQFGMQPPAIDKSKLEYKPSVWCPYRDMGKLYYQELKQAKNIKILLHANVTQLQANETQSVVEQVEIRTLDGKKGKIRARAIVLAGGGIENARLLLLSNNLGNPYDVVGRYFQEHLQGYCGIIETDTPLNLQNPYALLYKNKTRYLPRLHLTANLQEQEQVLNCTSNLVFEFAQDSAADAIRRISLAVRKGKLPKTLSQDLQTLVKDSGNLANLLYRRYVKGRSSGARPSRIQLITLAEQAPNRDSRITLSDQRDALGLNLVRVDWRLTDLDRRTAEVMTRTVQADFARLNLAKVTLPEWLTDDRGNWQPNFSGAYHPIGTTRMAENPREGVVDSNCQVHGVANLFIAGSSVFPTGGHANPTLTLIALALR
ncbi:MAG TPA: GMC family oxidoreductase, partial [Allocoleopsis sp.]